MIAVIADDLSGAAELAGAAHARGLTAEVQTVFDPRTEAEVVAVDTGTRACSRDEAAGRVRRIGCLILAEDPGWIYKKTDSVLRGHVRVEISELLCVAGKPRALFVPANPVRGRIIRRGCYLVEGIPLHQTVFALDSEYPAVSSDVRELLSRDRGENLVLAGDCAQLPPEGIVVPDVGSAADLARYAALADPSTVCAGAVEFFEALLVARTGRAEIGAGAAEPGVGGTTLLVCGSGAAWPARRQECERRGIGVLAMPPGLVSGGCGGVPDRPMLLGWAAETARILAQSGSALIAIGGAPLHVPLPPRLLVEALALAVEIVLRSTPVARVFLEGGATAAAVLNRMKGTRLVARGHFAPGLAAFELAGKRGPVFAIKPGSYDWPEQVWPVPSTASGDFRASSC